MLRLARSVGQRVRCAPRGQRGSALCIVRALANAATVFERGLARHTFATKGPKRATCALAVKQEVEWRRQILHDKAQGGEPHAFSLY